MKPLNFSEEASFSKDASFFGRRCLLFWPKMPPFSLENFLPSGILKRVEWLWVSRVTANARSIKTTAGTRQDGLDCLLANIGAIASSLRADYDGKSSFTIYIHMIR